MATTPTNGCRTGIPLRRGEAVLTRLPATRSALHEVIDRLPEGDLVVAAQFLDAVLAARNGDDQVLIDRWIRAHPHKSGLADAVLADSLVPVYAVIGALPGSGENFAEVAQAYEVPPEAVAAAVAYYRRHRPLIDERIYTGEPTPLTPA